MTNTDNSTRPMVIGLTGGIGSGKSAATAVFERLGIVVVDADVLSRVVVEPGKPALEKIAEHFGATIIGEDGTLNRSKLRELVFTTPSEKQWLEALLHPLIRLETEQRLRAATSPYVILSSPLLFETDQSNLVERVVLIDAPESVQLSRTSRRDNISVDAVSAIIRSQLPRHEKLTRADDVIMNDKDLAHLERSVKQLHDNYCLLAKERDQK